MNNEQLYPKSIENLMLKLQFIIKNEQNNNKIISIINWIDWFNKQKYTLKYELKDNEYLMAFYDNEKNALQVWNHGSDVDSVELNLISNFYSDYDTDITIVVED